MPYQARRYQAMRSDEIGAPVHIRLWDLGGGRKASLESVGLGLQTVAVQPVHTVRVVRVTDPYRIANQQRLCHTDDGTSIDLEPSSNGHAANPSAIRYTAVYGPVPVPYSLLETRLTAVKSTVRNPSFPWTVRPYPVYGTVCSPRSDAADEI
ncbi:hypothetical protein EXIGLDRAFT_708996 [Exidia glandulosa HHB12029]|uniref:Uncharacterized protein n=1 Tax=Exidia glandulosa HHB12029 TaxID=1314781 RepID=A0A166N087_EXIGL|nr:hypothetical protein EXIGLDRAFT_708996 [Exidia glandulosa HHB12029]